MKSIEQKNNNAKQFNKFLLPGTATNTKTTMQNNSIKFYSVKFPAQKNNDHKKIKKFLFHEIH